MAARRIATPGLRPPDRADWHAGNFAVRNSHAWLVIEQLDDVTQPAAQHDGQSRRLEVGMLSKGVPNRICRLVDPPLKRTVIVAEVRGRQRSPAAQIFIKGIHSHKWPG